MRRVVILGLVVACGGGGGGDDDGVPPDAFAGSCEGCVITPLDGDGCAAVALADDGALTWSDRACRPRGTQLAGSVARYFDWQVGDAVMHASGGPEYDGFGYVVSHGGPGAIVSGGDGATISRVLDGEHHAIRRAEWTVSTGEIGAAGTMRVVVDWFVASGRGEPVFAITHDTGALAADALRADARSPYGEVGFDGDQGGTVDGVEWGDAYRFQQLGTPLTKQNGWDYTESNAVPYALEWIGAHEMGLVQTEPQARHAAGGYWFYDRWGTRDDDGPFPEDYNWPYQLDQYSFAAGETTSSTRLAWGMNFGAVGQQAYAVLGEDPDNPPAASPSGWPFQSYAIFVVLGPHADAPVRAVAAEVEVASRVAIATTRGAVVAEAPGGVGRADLVTLAPPGWDPRYAVWRLDADDAGVLAATITVDGDAPLVAPIVVVRGAAADAPIRLAGTLQARGVDVLTSAADGELWITFRSAWRGPVPLVVGE